MTAIFVEAMSIPSASNVPPRRPSRPKATSRPTPATAGGSTSGKLDQGDDEIADREVRVATQYELGMPKRRISIIEIAFVSAVTMSASFAAVDPRAERGRRAARGERSP